MAPVDRRDPRSVPGASPGYDNARDLDLLRRIIARDRDALEELYTHYHRRLARFLTRLTSRYDVAEEVINDTLWVVWQRAGEFRGASAVSTWILGIAYRRTLTALRHVPVTLDPAEAERILDHGRHTDPADTAEQRDLLDRAMATLPLEQRMVLELTYYLGHSCQEIAEITDCPVNTVKTRMFHARRKLRQLLPALSGQE